MQQMSQELTLMTDHKDEIVKQKEFLAAEALKVANEAIGMLQDQLAECSTRDLVQIFSASVKAHREITEDIVVLTAKETPAEETLAREYDGKVGELLKRISDF
jgi:LytS/YehU family sensor histidine kinase